MLEKRVGEVAAEVARALSSELAIADDVAKCARWISTGAGASEGPARLFATLLRERGVLAEYVPISSFVTGAPRADACVVVSQRLSPNARVPLARANAYRHMLLVTTVDATRADARAHVVSHGPREEDGLLLRVIGPAAANATIIELAGKIAPPLSNGPSSLPANVAAVLATARDRALAALDEARAPLEALHRVVGIVATGADVALVHGLQHKLLEALGRAAPVWDLCGLVHGPLQSFYDRDATLVACVREGRPFGERAAARELGARLANVLHADRHRVIRLSSSLPGPLALLDFDLQLDHLVLEALRARPRDLADWPGKGLDAALYDLGTEI